ncbi:MAG: hypothetical protein Q7R89_01710 [bacterium]|nr:hypothetical protein [bacterium]
MKIKIDEIEVKIKLSNKPELKATAIIDFGDITIKGFRLSVSKHKNENLDNEMLYLQVPCFFAGKWREIVFINDKSKWKQIEKKVFEEYCNARNNSVDKDDNLWPKDTI